MRKMKSSSRLRTQVLHAAITALLLTALVPSISAQRTSAAQLGMPQKSLDAEAPIIDIVTNADGVEFNLVTVDSTAVRRVAVANRGVRVLSLNVAVTGDAFSLLSGDMLTGPNRTQPVSFELTSQQQTSFSVRFAPPAAGEFTGVMVLTSNDIERPEIRLPLTGSATEQSPGPSISSGGVVDAASFRATLAPGGIGSIFGQNLATEVVQATAVPLPLALDDTEVSVNGVPAPLFFVSPEQVNFQTPFEATGSTDAEVTVTRGGEPSPAETVSLSPYAPALFVNPTTGHPILVRQDGSLVTTGQPAQPDDVLIIYLTGIGGLDNPPTTGAAANSVPLASANTSPAVTVGGQASQVFFAGLTPGFVGLAQINIQLPSDLPTGPEQPLVVDFEGVQTPPLNLPVR